MELRPFGKTGIQISAVGFGCWEIGGGYGSIEESDFIKAVNRALDLGINCFDTAEAYGFGASEKSLAKALGSRRKEAVITTKFGVGYPDTPNYRDSTRKRVIESIDKSLKALNTDYVDVYLIHWPDRNHAVRRADAGARRTGEAGQGESGRPVQFQTERDRTMRAHAARRRRPVLLEHVRPPHAEGDFSVLPRKRHRRDGLRLVGLRDADRHPQRGEGVREGRLALAARTSWATSTCFSICSAPITFSRICARSRN